jgi:hypothetical protein
MLVATRDERDKLEPVTPTRLCWGSGGMKQWHNYFQSGFYACLL